MAAFLAPGLASASTITVTTTADSGAGSLRQAIAEATAGSTIVVPASAGAYQVTSGQLEIHKSLTIDGGGASATVLQGNGGGNPVIEVAASGVQISGVTITGGHQGVDLESGSLTLSASKVSQNGGSGVDGGGFETRPSTTLTIESSTIEGNTGYNGAGFDLGGAATIVDSTIAGNVAHGDGGVLQSSASLTLTRDAVTGNSAIENAGALFIGGTTTITDTTLADNHAGGDGGAIEGSTATLVNDTIANNEVAGSGAGIFGTATAANTIMADNTGPKGVVSNCTAALTVTGPNLENGTECGFAGHDGGISEANPELGALAANGGPTETLALLPGSPAIDHGTNVGCPATDQRGGARPQPVGGTCDIGAYEYGALADVGVSQSAAPTQLTAGELLTYSIAVTNNGPGPDPSFGVTLTDTLPAGASLVSAVPTQGSCPAAVSVAASPALPVSCTLGTLARGASAQVTIAVRPGLAGTAVNTATVGSDATDPNPANNSSQLSTLVLAAPVPTPAISGLSETATTWRESAGHKHGHSKHKQPPVGTTFTFTLNVPASVTFTFTTTAGGRRSGKACVAPSKKNKHGKRCTRAVNAGSLTVAGKAGANSVRFTGKLSNGKTLKPGSYTATVIATASGKTSPAGKLHFKVAG